MPMPKWRGRATATVKSDPLYCLHSKIKVSYTERTTYIHCAKCFGYITQFRRDIPDSQNFDKLLARRLYIFGDVYELKEEQLRRWV